MLRNTQLKKFQWVFGPNFDYFDWEIDPDWDDADEIAFVDKIRKCGRLESWFINDGHGLPNWSEVKKRQRTTEQILYSGLTAAEREQFFQEAERHSRQAEERQREIEKEAQAAAEAEWRADEQLRHIASQFPHMTQQLLVDLMIDWRAEGKFDAVRRGLDSVVYLWRRSRMMAGFKGTAEESMAALIEWKQKQTR